jgi:hypothetical protein
MRLEHPQAGRIQQGGIFNCLLEPGYSEYRCHGIVLTARCDLEHNKQSVINFLPILPFRAWVERALCRILAQRLTREISRAVEKQLREKGVSDQVLTTFPLADIATRETRGRERDELLKRVEELDLVRSAAGELTSKCSVVSDVIRIAGKRADRLVEEMIQQKLQDYYFLDGLDVTEREPTGSVILLRNMRSLAPDLMNRIVGGIAAEDVAGDTSIDHILTFAHEPICMITGVLRSPDIEHLGQQFANLFVRIGLEDHDRQQIERHCELAKGR